VAREAPIAARVERELYDAARRAAGLPADATQGQVVRYALAALAGDRDPRSAAVIPLGGANRRALRRVAATA
jgi:hypothetical protein